MKSFKIATQAAIAALLIAGTSGAARADLTVSGAVGLPLNPTAQIPQPNGARVQGNFYQLGDTVAGKVNHYGIFGAARLADRFEINGGVNKLDGPGVLGLDETGFAIGAKYLFSRETEPAGVRIALGAGYDHALYRNINAYVVASKYLGTLTEGRTPITGHLGLRYDRFKLNTVGFKSNKASIFAGAEVPFTRDGALQFVGEIGSKNARAGEFPFSAGLRYRPLGQGYSASIGVQRQGLIDDTGLYLQLGYSFDTAQAGP
jgi:hypothetical protein